MDVLEKIKKLTDKVNGLGLPMVLIGKYCGCHPNTLKYYLLGGIPKPEVIQQYEDGLRNLMEDIKTIVEG